jgi:hypothetical protein
VGVDERGEGVIKIENSSDKKTPMGSYFSRVRPIAPPLNGFLYRSDGLVGCDGSVEREKGAETEEGKIWVDFVLARMAIGFRCRKDMEDHLRELEAWDYTKMSVNDAEYARGHINSLRYSIQMVIECEKARGEYKGH